MLTTVPISKKVPLLQMLEHDKGTKALFIYPTKVSPKSSTNCIMVQFFLKALAQDQKAALEQLLSCCPGLEHTFVGDLAALSVASLKH